LKAEAIRHYGTLCQICSFDFGEHYGEDGDGYIEIHHLKPISDNKHIKVVTSINDVRMVCSNCHRMLHRKGKLPYNFDDFLKKYQKLNK
jgi:5-methylcytosine-specific restriction protein A